MGSSIPFTQWVSLILSFVLVLGLLVGTLYLLRRFSHARTLRGGARRIEALESHAIGQRQRLLLIRIDDREMLLGVGQQQTNVLGSWPAREPKRGEGDDGIGSGDGRDAREGRPRNPFRLNFAWAGLALLGAAIGFFASPDVLAQGLPAVTASTNGQSTQYSLTLQLLALMTLLTLLPSLLLMMTSFVRIVIVLSILRQALGTAQTPPNQVLVGLALFLSLFVMSPVLTEVHQRALVPYLDAKMSVDEALTAAQAPIRNFMLKQTREDDIATFVQISGGPPVESANDVPFLTLVPAFITSELRSAFTIGFLIYIPFVVIDLVVASVLMSMGMMMLSPMMISMPFKLMLFVLVDGWSLMMSSLAGSFVIN